MSLEVQFSNGTALPAREAVLSRALGRAVRWRFEVYVPEPRRRDDLAKLIDALGSQRVTATAGFIGESSDSDAEFGLEGVVTHAWWGDHPDHAVLEVQNTRLSEETPNPLLPRWRIHHVDDLYKLAQKFGHLAQLGGPGVKNALSAVTFPDGDRANVVQAGLSDWDFVATLIWQYRHLGKDQGLKPLILSGSVAPATEGKWVYTWGCRKAFETAGEVTSRTVTLAEGDGYSRPMFAGRTGDEPARHAVIPGADIPRAGVIRHRRTFSAASWNEWRQKDAPFFLDGAMCWRVVDRLYDTGHPGFLGWTSMLEFMPAEGMPPQEFPPLPPRAWTGAGKVKKHYVKGPWIDIELPAFVDEKSENVVHTRLTTHHSGLNGHAGLHLIPEKDTHVDVAWSGRFDQSVVCVANRRMKDTEYKHPSLWIESDSIGQFADLTIKKIGVTHIESDWKVDIEKQTVIRSEKPMTLIGDGIKAEYKSGRIHVSKGRPSTMRPPTGNDAEGPMSDMAEAAASPTTAVKKLTIQEHLDLMKAAEAQGVETVKVKNAAGVEREVKVYGANPAELAQIRSALTDLAKHDKHDLLIRPTTQLYVTDLLPSRDPLGKAQAAGRAFQHGGQNVIMLSRLKGFTKENKLEKRGPLRHVLYHEMGHALDNQYQMSSTPGSEFGKGDPNSHDMGGDFISKYAATNPKEDYAETFAAYHTTRTHPDMDGCSDQECVEMACLCGGKRQGKMEHMVKDLGPQAHSRRVT